MGLKAVWAVARPSATTEAEWDARFSHEPFFRVPFTQALDLVAHRRVYLSGGFAYVPRERLTAIIVARFRAELSRSLVLAAKALPAVLQDERLGPVLGNMSRAYLGAQYGPDGASARAGAGKQVKAADVDRLAGTSFPLCMSGLHRALREHSHLKHGGRMQYGLFLKGIGLGLEEALVFWQAHFTRKMSAEDFVKKYAYNIRHNYGKEGKRADYTPFSCVKIITGTAPGAGEVHGCPYRHWDQTAVRTALLSRGLAPPQVERVMDSVKSRDYQIACRREFEARHGEDSDEVGQHPNGYYSESQRIHAARLTTTTTTTAAAAAAAAGGAAPVPGTSASDGAPAAAMAATEGGVDASDKARAGSAAAAPLRGEGDDDW